MFKKITVALFFVLAGTSALAAQTDNSMPIVSGVALMAPHQEGSWSFGIQANYLEPDTDYKYFHTALDTPNFFPLDGGDATRIYTVGSDYDWGWGADISYHFPGNGRDVNLAFTQLNTGHSDSETDPNQSFMLGGGAIDIQQSGDHSAKVETNYNSADLTFGQIITAGTRISLHPFAGLRYASIDYEAKARGDDAYNASNPFSATEVRLSVTDESTWESDFEGLGPRFGSDAEVNLGRGFSLRSTLGLSLLVGNIDVRGKQDHNETLKLYLNSTDPNPTILIDQATNTDNKIETNTRVVPEADAKLSLMYKVDVNNGYSLGFEAGYQVTNYFDAIQNSVISTQDTSTQYTSYFIQGPYARLELDVA